LALGTPVLKAIAKLPVVDLFDSVIMSGGEVSFHDKHVIENLVSLTEELDDNGQ